MSLIEIILRAKPYIYQSPVVNAMWIEGSYATGSFKDSSDIDVWFDIAPSTQAEAVVSFEAALSEVVKLRSVSDIDFYSQEPKLAKVKLYVDKFNDDNRIELDIQESTREFVFDRDKHDIIILFDKTGVIEYGN